VRVALHPVDAEHPEVLEHWRRVLRQLVASRQPVTKAQALGFA